MTDRPVPAQNAQYSQSTVSEYFLQYRDRAMRREKGAKRDQRAHIASASQGYDEANPTLQARLEECWMLWRREGLEGDIYIRGPKSRFRK
jgi:hypothetical protein